MYLHQLKLNFMIVLRNILFILCILGVLQVGAQTQEYYQLKTYTFDSDAQQELTDDYLKNAFLPALKAFDIKNVGVFKPRPTDSVTPKKTYVLIPFASLVQFRLLDDALTANTEYQNKGKAYLQAPHDKPPYHRIESVLMKAFSDMPLMQASMLDGPRKERIYELRSYEGATEELYKKKVDMFNAGGEVTLFDRLGFNAVFYAEVLAGPTMPNLMYMTTHANQKAIDMNWKALVDSPEWTKLKVMPKYQNTVSKNVTLFLYPTEYSDY